ncbi:MAG: histidinol-phosphate transaminase [Pseudomonadales bacterium]|nr:histidinol-phosphate transaminase [Pseudomonadales bacterium]
MSCDFVSIATEGVQGLTPYQPGKPVEELERELGIQNIVKLASNENPLGASPRAAEAIQAQISELTRYPDGNGFILKQALSQHLGVNLDAIVLGNGSNDVLNLIARAYLAPGYESLFSAHAFAVYPIATQAVGAKAVVAPAKNWGHDLEAMASAITDKTKVIFLANPNNPTGTWFTRADFETFIKKVPENVIVVLDEAYFEYVDEPEYPNGLDYLSQYPNLIVSRTFSKAYGLASLRVGYSISNPQIADVLNRVRSPFNVDSFALAAAVAVLDDKEYLQKSIVINREGMEQVTQGLENMGLSYIPSVGNFVSVDFGKDAMPIYEALLREGVIVRPVGPYKMPTFLRISIGLPEENARFLGALQSSAVKALL